jgi:hypothetical protein
MQNLETLKLVTLPVLYLNREGDPEPGHQPKSFELRGESNPLAVGEAMIMPTDFNEQSEAYALNKLRRALGETGQLIVLPCDGLSRISFTGIGDPDNLLVESIPEKTPFPIVDFDIQGKLYSLSQAESLLTRLYCGESSAEVSAFSEHF